LRKLNTCALAGAAAAALAAALMQPATAAQSADAPGQTDRPARTTQHREDNLPGPLTDRQTELRQTAVAKLVDGKATMSAKAKGGSTVRLGRDTYVEFPRERDDKIFTVLSDFSDVQHNQIPKPDRTKDNSTIWSADFNKAHYEDMFDGPGESMKNFYEQLSSGRYSVTNTVADWVKVGGTAASYGDNPHENQGGAWDFINDTGNAWYDAQVAAGKTPAEIDDYLSQFDQWDRYDFDGDGNFNEPDGYIDHFQAIHAGQGEEAGAPASAIWSHRWYTNPTDFGKTGPTVGDGDNAVPNLMGGSRIGGSRYYLGDYTVEPENGGLGVFAHEFGHDLGLPDFYDTAGGDNGTGFWTLMSAGSWLSHGTQTGDGIGYTPGNMGAEEKMFLGWLDFATVDPGHNGRFNLGPAAHTSKTAKQAIAVNLPDKTTTSHYATPPSGAREWWSQRGDGLNNTLTREVPAAQTVTVDASAWYSIEKDFDYLYGEYSTDNGATWTQVNDPVTGDSPGWTKLSYTYNAGGSPTLFRFRYQTDGGVNEEGAFLDDITVATDGTTVVTDGAEDGDNGWTVRGWKTTTGTESVTTPQYYLLENRAHVGYDDTLRTGPYNFSKGVTKPSWVEFFPYQEGMLVWYVDYAYPDNNTTAHPGHGAALPVDARPEPFKYGDGTQPGNRRQPFDATFGVQKTDPVCLHKEVADGDTVRTYAACAPKSKGIPTFDDSNKYRYYSSANPLGSTLVAGAGVRATVTGQSGDTLKVSVVNGSH
jgi:immune inhibitor A